MTIQEKLQKYESLKLQIKEAEEVIKELQPDIIDAIPEDKEVAGEFGYFVVQDRPKWEFSEAVKEAELVVKKLKKEEKAKGVATATPRPTLYYKTN